MHIFYQIRKNLDPMHVKNEGPDAGRGPNDEFGLTSQLFPAKFSGQSHTSTPRMRVSVVAGCRTSSSEGLPVGGGTAVSSVRPKMLQTKCGLFPH